jgi:hypothetical protein
MLKELEYVYKYLCKVFTAEFVINVQNDQGADPVLFEKNKILNSTRGVIFCSQVVGCGDKEI